MFMPSGVVAITSTLVPPAPQFNVVGGNLSHQVSNGSTATVEIEFTAGGAENHIKDGLGRQQVGNWYTNAFPSEYELQYQLNFGDTPQGSLVNTWIPGNNLIAWSFTLSANNSQLFCGGDVIIRRIADQVIVAQNGCFLDVVVGTPP